MKPSLLYLNDLFDEKEQLNTGVNDIGSFTSMNTFDLSLDIMTIWRKLYRR